MSSPWLASKTPVGPPTAANPTVRQLLYAAAVTGGWAGLISLVIYLIGHLFGMTFTVSAQADAEPAPVQWFVVLLLPLVAAVVFALLASLARGWPHARRIVFWAGTLGALASLIPVLNQPASVGWFSRVVLASMHVVTWFLVVPQIARIVGDSEPGQHVDRDE
jgi:Family of unknown function (DUF6069)